jgi:uncharacterized protein with PIN domain
MALVYIDTSALAKWYLNEAHAHEFSNWIQKQEDTHISSLTITEFRCLLARRRRNYCRGKNFCTQKLLPRQLLGFRESSEAQ